MTHRRLRLKEATARCFGGARPREEQAIEYPFSAVRLLAPEGAADAILVLALALRAPRLDRIDER
jgi:hypothetical protein